MNGNQKGRISGFDLARSLAILGMVLVHFALVAATDHASPAALGLIVRLLDGRAAATFVVLSGIGMTLMTQRIAPHDFIARRNTSRTLFRRGLFLLALGFLNLTIWPGDILRVYGVSLMLASRFFDASARTLLGIAVGCVIGFIVLMGLLDFSRNWDWESMTYHGLWTAEGIVRNLFFDGFRSVFPWTGLVFYGMWLGRLDLTDRRMNNRVLFAALTVVVIVETVSAIALAQLRQAGFDQELVYWLGTESMPTLPLFLLAAGGSATLVIAVCVRITSRSSAALTPLIATGRMALTWYVSHIVLGLGTIVALDLVTAVSLPLAFGFGLTFFLFAMIVSTLWKSRFRYGPLEAVMRRITDGS